ncbi:HTH domain-containing protein [Bremerella cremea]|uniref:HTH domain-containing protein n=1 Tax=Bremerella cremea TaxID=1031537 RepID=A0A368KM39_9BACT|nr:recombinase family protein [Bremerella cremea]RCS42294.1 HTH domain-containing protein [Bremerella cremea]
MKTAVYVRVSTVGQNEAGQSREIQRWLKGNGITDVEWYTDKQTGDNLDRPGFEKLQADIFAGRIGSVVVWRLDRLSRKLRDGLDVLCQWTDKGIRVVSVTQQIDLTGTVGKMMAAVLLGVAEMEQETRRERQAAGIEAAKQKGVYKGRKPGATKASPAKVAELRGRGWSDAEIAQHLEVSRQTVWRYGKRAG